MESDALRDYATQLRALAPVETPPTETPQRWEHRLIAGSGSSPALWSAWKEAYLSALNDGWEFINLTVEENYWFATLRHPVAAAPVPDNSAELADLRARIAAARKRLLDIGYSRSIEILDAAFGRPAEKGGEV